MNSISCEKIEKELGLIFPEELEAFYNKIFSQDKAEYIFKVSHLTNNWIFSKYSFWILMSEINDISDYDIYKSESTNKVSIINASKMLSSSLRESVLCFAWSHDSVERDTGIFYKPDGKIYGYSGNFSNEGEAEFLANNLIDLFNIQSENRILKISEILEDNQWFYGDQECVDNAKDYHSVIKNYFIKTSVGLLRIDDFSSNEIDLENRELNLMINNKKFSCILKTHNGWIDPLIVDFMNNVLKEVNIENLKFVEIKDSSWGQEMGVACVSNEQINKLKKFGYLIK